MSLFASRDLQNNVLAELLGVSVLYQSARSKRKIEALKDFDFTLTRGEFVFVTGVSGAGKTTLLQILSKSIKPGLGKIFFAANLRVSSVFQDLRLLQKECVLTNLDIAYTKEIHGSRKNFSDERDDLIEVFGLGGRELDKVCFLNGGLRQKLSIARALLSRPDLILADEPSSALDKTNARTVYEVLKLYNSKRGHSVVWATHNRDLVSQFHGRIVHIDRGRALHSGHACFI